MKNTQRNMRIALFVVAVFTSCRKEETSKSSPPNKELPESVKISQSPSLPKTVEDSPDAIFPQQAVRMPKQRHPEIIASPAKPNPVGERLARELSGLNPSGKVYLSRIRTLWEESIQRISDQPLQSGNDGEIAEGVILPSEVKSLKETDRAQDTPAANLYFLVFASLASGQENLIHEFAKQRANSLPPTTADLAIYEALNAGIGEFTTTRGQSSYASFEKWEPLANAANPIYRLLALRAASLAVSKSAWETDIDSKEFNQINELPKMDFYLSYLDEKDPIILSKAIRSLSFVPLPEAREAIEKFHAQQLQKGDPVLIQAAEEALKTQENISR